MFRLFPCVSEERVCSPYSPLRLISLSKVSHSVMKGSKGSKGEFISRMGPGDWCCGSCGGHNYNKNVVCYRCKAGKNDPVQPTVIHCIDTGANIDLAALTQARAQADAHRGTLVKLSQKELQVKTEFARVKSVLDDLIPKIRDAHAHQKVLDDKVSSLESTSKHVPYKSSSSAPVFDLSSESRLKSAVQLPTQTRSFPPPPTRPAPAPYRRSPCPVREAPPAPGAVQYGYASACKGVPLIEPAPRMTTEEILIRSRLWIKTEPASELTSALLDRQLADYKATQTPAVAKTKEVSEKRSSPDKDRGAKRGRSHSRSKSSDRSESRSDSDSRSESSEDSRSRTQTRSPTPKRRKDRRSIMKGKDLGFRYPPLKKSKRVRSDSRDDQYPPRRAEQRKD